MSRPGRGRLEEAPDRASLRERDLAEEDVSLDLCDASV